MQHLTATTALKDFNIILDTVIKHNQSISIATDNGAAILVSESEWNGLMETLYLKSIPGMLESIKAAHDAPASERLEDIGWDIN